MPRYSEEEARQAIARASSYADALRRLGMCRTGGNHVTLRKYAEEVWRIPTDHFDPDSARVAGLRRPATPLDEILIEGSTYHRGHLKLRLYEAGLKSPRCELCGQGEMWHGKPMALILDHVNGVSNDHRLQNLRIVCPNCAATLETHCGRQLRISPRWRLCALCGRQFCPKSPKQHYCSRACGQRHRRTGRPRPDLRKVERPPRAQLLREVRELGYLATGRRYGVSDNAIRKWIRQYEIHEGPVPK